jgi:tRNA G37 N-methylase Trm5
MDNIITLHSRGFKWNLLLTNLNSVEFDTYILQFIQEGDVVIDIGSGIGYNTLEFSRKVGPCGVVYAFEFRSNMVSILRSNIYNNDISNVVIYNNNKKLDDYILENPIRLININVSDMLYDMKDIIIRDRPTICVTYDINTEFITYLQNLDYVREKCSALIFNYSSST